MLPIAWFAILVIPFGILMAVGNDWRNARDLFKSFKPERSNLFDTFKKNVFKDNYETVKYDFVSVIIFFSLLLIIFFISPKGQENILSTQVTIGVLFMCCFIFLLLHFFLARTKQLKEIQNKNLSAFIKDKKILKDVKLLLKTHSQIKEITIKHDLEDKILYTLRQFL